ncbi:MAG: hypothetical protein A3F43_05410 [Gammaproteobacteria bacterium RIFCSPHIGHO2_12_FULL_42_10]|nr:MAG: hypothetical protein A3F43_05410 [Gammaproteobacteria bacterium RIFCSPHIGHO2_12_FULL_42_10]
MHNDITSNQEKISKMLIVGFKGTVLHEEDPVVRAILQKQIGGVILFAENIVSPLQLSALTKQLRRYADHAALSDFIISIDYEGGTVHRLPESLGFPKRLSAQMMSTLSFAEAKAEAQRMTETLEKFGFNLNFAPVVDVNVNPDNPILGKRERCFSGDPAKVADYANIVIESLNERGITAVIKHFPGHGSSLGDTHLGFVDVTETWQSSELEPYKQLLQHQNDRLMIMTAHVVHRGFDASGLPASLSKAMTTDLLRDITPHRFTIVADDLQMRAVRDHYSLEDAVRLAIAAGADHIIIGNQLMAHEDSMSILDMMRIARILPLILKGLNSEPGFY